MSDNRIEQLESDLQTIRAAAGVELPFGWEDVWIALGSGAGGLVAAVWALVPHGLPRYWGFVPVLAFVLVGTGWLRTRYRQNTGRSPVRRREYTAAILLVAIVVPIMVAYRVWGAKLGIPLQQRAAIAMFFCGLALLFPAVIDRSRIYYLAIALPLILAGLAMPFVPLPREAVVAIALTIGSPAAAAIEAYQLRKREAAHAAH